MPRTADARPLAATLLLASAGPTLVLAPTSHAGAVPVNSWLGASDGLWSDASRWSLGAPPPTDPAALLPDLLFDAVGAPYTISNAPTPLLGYTQNVLVDSHDVTLGLTSRLVVLDRFDLRRGTLRLNGSIETTDFVIGPEASFIGVDREDGTLYGRVVNQGRIDLSGDYSLRIDTHQSGFPRTLVNEGVLSVTGDRLGGPRVNADQILNSGVIDLSPGTGSAFNALRGAEFILNEGEIVMNGPTSAFQTFRIESDLTNAGVIRLKGNATLQLFDNVTTFVGDGRIIGGGVAVGLEGTDRDTIVEGTLRTDSGVALVDRAKIRGGVFTPESVSVYGPGVEVVGGISSGNTVFFTNTSPMMSGPLSARALRIDASTIDIDGAAFITEDAEIIGGSLALRDPASEFGSLFLLASSVAVGVDASNEKYGLRVFGDLAARSNSSLLNRSGSVVVDGDLDWNTAAGSRIETSLDVAGNALIRNADICASVHARRVTLGGVITGNPDMTVTDGAVVTQAGVIRPGGANEHGRFAVDGDLFLGNGLASRVELDLLADPDGAASLDVFEVERGDATLNAALHIVVGNDAGAILQLGDSFTLLTADSISGEFLRLTHTAFSNELFFDVAYEHNAVRLVVVPAPAATSLLACAGLAAIRRRRA